MGEQMIEEYGFLYDMPKADFAGMGLHYRSGVYYGRKHPREYMNLIYRDGCENMPVVIWIHGGAWDDEFVTVNYRPEPTLAVLAEKGYLIACIEYRLSRHAALPACIEDCQMAVRYLRKHADEYHINPNKIGLWGESAGAHIACMVGSNYNDAEGAEVQSVVSFYCPSDLLAQICFFGGTPGFVVNALPKGKLTAEEMEEILWELSPVRYANKKNLPPFLLFHGDKDELVDYNESVDYVKKLKEAGHSAKLVTVPGQGHGFFEGQKYYDEVLDFFDGTIMTK